MDVAHMPRHVVVLGAAGGAHLVYWHLQAAYPATRIACVCDDVADVTDVRMGDLVIPVIKDWDFSRLRREADDPEAYRLFIVGSGDPKVKEMMVQKALAHGLEPAPTVVHPRACVMGNSTVGRGGLFSPGAVVANNATVGDYVHLAPHTLVGHDCQIGDYVSCNPGSQVLGYVTLGDGVSLGAGTIIRERLCIAPGVITGAQTYVSKDILESGMTLVGIPARKLR